MFWSYQVYAFLASLAALLIVGSITGSRYEYYRQVKCVDFVAPCPNSFGSNDDHRYPPDDP